ncbi:unnamed protein product [Adineta steineri]|uniref:Uncharacterized protein n=1 Tax=Adineta steineri TaxID=433720 RepID=A0A813NCY3_9BILA|nr:unnamed protein product [Adineta steineri]
MQSATSLSSISSSTSSNSSIYGSRTILETKDLPFAAPRCRSSIAAFLDDDQTIFSSPSSSPPPLPPPRRRQSQLPSSNKTMVKCRQLFRTCLSSTSSSPLSLPTQTAHLNTTLRKEYFAKLCHNHRLLLVLTDYQCKCGCHFSMEEGSFVILYETKNELSTFKKSGSVTVISNELVCSKVPIEFVCDVELLRSRVRTRRFDSDDEQSFDL